MSDPTYVWQFIKTVVLADAAALAVAAVVVATAWRLARR